MLELQFTTTKTLKASKQEFPADWMMDQQPRILSESLPLSAPAQGASTPPLVTTNPFLDPNVISMGIHLTNPFLDHGPIRPTPTTTTGISPRTINNLASLGTPSITMPFHTG